MSDTVRTRLKYLRTARKMTLDQLAAQSGLSKGYLSKIEKGDKIPPIATLQKIGSVLGAKLAYFFEESESTETQSHKISVVRAHERGAPIKGGSSFGYDSVAIARDIPNRLFDPFIFHIYEDSEGETPFSHDGEEMIFVLSGTLNLRVHETDYCLMTGDCAYFDASLDHKLKALNGDATALVIFAAAPS